MNCVSSEPATLLCGSIAPGRAAVSEERICPPRRVAKSSSSVSACRVAEGLVDL